jgi:hypothetical protein
MLSLTVRHTRGDDLRTVRKGLANAYRRFVRGAPWARLATEAGLEHWIRALEITHGPNGWHPHLHVLWLLELPLSADALETLTAKLRARWADCVARELGEASRPNAHGLDLRQCRDAEYIQKFAFELVDPAAAKAAARGHRNPWQIAVSASQGDERDGYLWQRYCAGMRGARMLTWSRGLKEFAGLADRDDQEAAEAEPNETETVAVVPAHVWDALRYRRHAACALLDAAELAGSVADAHRAVQAFVDDAEQRALRARQRAAA